MEGLHTRTWTLKSLMEGGKTVPELRNQSDAAFRGDHPPREPDLSCLAAFDHHQSGVPIRRLTDPVFVLGLDKTNGRFHISMPADETKKRPFLLFPAGARLIRA